MLHRLFLCSILPFLPDIVRWFTSNSSHFFAIWSINCMVWVKIFCGRAFFTYDHEVIWPFSPYLFRQSVFIMFKSRLTFTFVNGITSRTSNMCNAFLHSSEMVLLTKIVFYIFRCCFLKCILCEFSTCTIQFTPDKCHMNLIKKCN